MALTHIQIIYNVVYGVMHVTLRKKRSSRDKLNINQINIYDLLRKSTSAILEVVACFHNKPYKHTLPTLRNN